MFVRISVLRALAVITPLAAVLPTAAAFADGSGTVSATVTVAPPAVRSITVSPAAMKFGSCQAGGQPSPAGLVIPHGTCSTPDGTGTDAPLTITNGAVASHIDVNGSDAIPADNGQHWTLCGTSTSCTAMGAPGADQYALDVKAAGNTAEQPPLGTTPACDNVFQESAVPAAAGCSAAPGQTAHEWLRLTAPDSSTDTSSSFVTTVTWTAVP